MILLIGDVHWKEKRPYFEGLCKLFDYILDKYPDATYVMSGDWFDTSSPRWDTYEKSLSYLLRMKSVHIVEGNHDFSYNKRSSLVPLNSHANINIYNEKTIVDIEGQSFLMLPFNYNQSIMKDYENIVEEFDFAVTHTTPKEVAFGEHGIDYKNLKGKHIFHGHEHMSKEFGDQTIIGVPQTTRNGEQPSEKRMVIIENGEWKFESLPIFMDIKDIEYGEEITEKGHIYNILNAPSVDSVYNKYQEKNGFNIRREGITVLRTTNGVTMLTPNRNMNNDLTKQFTEYANNKEEELKLSKEVINKSLEYLNKVS